MPGPRRFHFAVHQEQKVVGTYSRAACGQHGYLIAVGASEVTCGGCNRALVKGVLLLDPKTGATVLVKKEVK